MNYFDVGDTSTTARVGRSIDRLAYGFASILLNTAGQKLQEIFSLKFVEPGMTGCLLDIYAHQVHLTLRYIHACKNGRLVGRLQLHAVNPTGDLGQSLLEISVESYALRFSDELYFASNQINSESEHEHIALQASLRFLAAAQSMLPNLDNDG